MQNFFISKRFQNIYIYFYSVTLIIYITVDLPKLYLFSILLFPLYFYFTKVKINFLDIYLIPLVLLCFYIEPSFYAFKFDINILAHSVWGVTAFVIGVVIFNEIINLRLNLRKIIVFIFIGSLINFLIIYIFNVLLFDFPITRNGFIHPFTNLNGEFLIFNLENIKKINPVSIRSLYAVLEIMLTCSILLGILYKKEGYFFFLNKYYNFYNRMFIRFKIICNLFFCYLFIFSTNSSKKKNSGFFLNN